MEGDCPAEEGCIDKAWRKDTFYEPTIFQAVKGGEPLAEALEAVEECRGKVVMEDLVEGEDVKLQKVKGKKRKAKTEGKRKAGEAKKEDEDYEMEGVVANKRVRAYEEHKQFGEDRSNDM
jgi:hypothetical protein